LNVQHPLVPDHSWPLTETGVVRNFGRKFGISDLRGGQFVTSPFGLALAHTATGDKSNLDINSPFVLPTQYFSAMLLYQKRDAINRISGAFGISGATVAQLCDVRLPTNTGIANWDFGGQTEGTTRLSVSGLTFGADIWFFTTGARGMEIWQNGILVAANSANPTRTSASNKEFQLGTYGGGASDLANFGGFHLWRRQLEPGDIKHLSAHPWAFFRAPFLDLLSTAPPLVITGFGRILSDERNRRVRI
jgi:hypothetical protein